MITETHEFIDLVATRLDQKAGPLGLQYVGRYDEKLIPTYPAVVVLPGRRRKTLHGLHTFEVEQIIHLFVYHANMTLTKRERSKADAELAARIELELDSRLNWEGQVVHAWVTDSEPGILQPVTNKSPLVISTRLEWFARSQRRF